MKEYIITLRLMAECDSDALELVEDYGLEDNCELITMYNEKGENIISKQKQYKIKRKIEEDNKKAIEILNIPYAERLIREVKAK